MLRAAHNPLARFFGGLLIGILIIALWSSLAGCTMTAAPPQQRRPVRINYVQAWALEQWCTAMRNVLRAQERQDAYWLQVYQEGCLGPQPKPSRGEIEL